MLNLPGMLSLPAFLLVISADEVAASREHVGKVSPTFPAALFRCRKLVTLHTNFLLLYRCFSVQLKFWQCTV